MRKLLLAKIGTQACPCIPLFVLLSSFPMAQNSKKSPCIPTFVSKRILFLLARNSSREERGFVSARKSHDIFMPPAAKKQGRPAKEPNQPPMPAFWKETERLAVCLAYLEASEQGAATPDVLERVKRRGSTQGSWTWCATL